MIRALTVALALWITSTLSAAAFDPFEQQNIGQMAREDALVRMLENDRIREEIDEVKNVTGHCAYGCMLVVCCDENVTAQTCSEKNGNFGPNMDCDGEWQGNSEGSED